jgi:hypothetical protein
MAKYKITLHIEDDGGWYDNKPDLLIQESEESSSQILRTSLSSLSCRDFTQGA